MISPELIIVGGKPYSGKSTIARRLVELGQPEGVRHLPMGERLRAIGAGRIVSKYADILMQSNDALAKHKAVHKDIPIGAFEEFVEEAPESLIVADGFPRYPDRLEGFRESIQRIGAKVIAVCRVDVDDEVVHERSKGREQRTAGVVEDRAFVEGRLDDFRHDVSPTLDALANDYPFYVLDGTDPVDLNAGKLLGIYMAAARS